MTPEVRLDRLERFVRLFVRAGVRYRRDLRELGDKLNIMVNMQIQNGERFSRNEERLAKLTEKTDQRFVQLAESQARTDRNLGELIKILRSDGNGRP